MTLLRALETARAHLPDACPGAANAPEPSSQPAVTTPRQFADAYGPLITALKQCDPATAWETPAALALLDVSEPALAAKIATSELDVGLRRDDGVSAVALADFAARRGIWAGLALPVTSVHEPLRTRGGSISLPGGQSMGTLGIAEISATPHAGLRETLLARYHAVMRLALSCAAQGASWPTATSAQRGPWSVEIQDRTVTVRRGERGPATRSVTTTVAADGQGGSPPLSASDLAFVCEAIEQLAPRHGAGQLSRRALRPDLARVFTELLAVHRPAQRSEALQQPALVVWDCHGTADTLPGMQNAVRALEARGAVNVVASSVPPEPIEQSFEGGGVQFAAYFGGSYVRSGGNKSYSAVLAACGVSSDQASDRALFVGNEWTDAPADVPGAVFVLVHQEMSATAVTALVSALDAAGDGSLRRGFEALSDPMRRPHGLAFKASVHEVSPGHPVYVVQRLAFSSDVQPAPPSEPVQEPKPAPSESAALSPVKLLQLIRTADSLSALHQAEAMIPSVLQRVAASLASERALLRGVQNLEIALAEAHCRCRDGESFPWTDELRLLFGTAEGEGGKTLHLFAERFTQALRRVRWHRERDGWLTDRLARRLSACRDFVREAEKNAHANEQNFDRLLRLLGQTLSETRARRLSSAGQFADDALATG